MASDVWLEQSDIKDSFLDQGRGPWTTVYRADDNRSDQSVHIYCALSSPDRRDQALSDPGWDLLVAEVYPVFSKSHDEDGNITTAYHRLGADGKLEPLVLRRDFHGAHPGCLEISEEFRLFHNLWWDAQNCRFIKPNEDGTDDVAIEMADDLIQVATRLLRQFQAAKQMDLLLFIDSVRYASSKESGLPLEDAWSDDTLCGARYANRITSPPLTRLLATRVLPPPAERAGIWPYEAVDERFPEFIIGSDDNGAELRHTCNPDTLANYYEANPDAPRYLTPVHFRREVLQKYYNHRERFSVEDGYLRCAGLWGLRMANDQPEHVVVFLGDLGRDLPQAERDYWRSFNVAPGPGLSETGFRRAFLGQFADPRGPDLRLQRLYQQFMEDWVASEGWSLFKELKGPDKYLVGQLRVPLNDTQAEFEACVSVLAKLLTDGLDVRAIQRQLPDKVPDEKGIAKLERWLRAARYPAVDRDIRLLRDLQELRSKVAAHRKGSDYEKSLDKLLGAARSHRAAVQLMADAILMLETLEQWRVERAAAKSE